MASAYSLPAIQTLNTLRRTTTPHTPCALPLRRNFLYLSSAATLTFLSAGQLTAKAEDIGLFGIRKRIKEVEKEAEEIVEAAEKKVEAAEEEIEAEASAVGFGGFVQAGVVAGAEVVGVLVASSVVNGILGPEGQNS